MTTFLVISVIVAVAGVLLAMWKEKRVPDSLSGMVFTLKGSWKWAWTIWLWVISFTIGIPTIDALPSNAEFIGFLMMASLMFVGAMPLFQSDTKVEHYVFAITGGVLSQIAVALISPWCLLVWVLFAGYVGVLIRNVYYKKNYKQHWYDYKGVFLAEVLCFLGLMLACAIR